MATFYFEAKDGRGVNISGQLEAESEREAVKQLQSQGFFVLRLRAQVSGAAPAGVRPVSWFGRNVLEPVFLPVGSKALSLFFSSFASTLAAGMNLHEAALHLGRRARGSTLKKTAREMAQAASQGKPVTTVARRYPGAFSPFVVAMLEAGELAGTQERSMKQLAEYFQRTYELEMLYRLETFYTKMVLAFLVIYPAIAPVALAIIRGGLAAGVRVGLSFLLASALPFVLKIVAVWYGWRLLMRVRLLRRGVDRVKLSIPLLIGPVVRRNAMSKWCRAMAVLYGAGVPLQKAVECAGEASGNSALAASTSALAYKVNQGVPISVIMEESGDFSETAIDLMATGERTGNVEESLLKVAEYADTESQTSSKQSAVLVGIVAYLVVAVFVAREFLGFWTGYFDKLLSHPPDLSDIP